MKQANIVWQPNKVSHEERLQILKQESCVVWFTGLSGSGKSTIAVEVEKALQNSGYAVYLLDGDNIRHGINSDLGFTDSDRDENIRRISEIAALFQDAGLITLVSFISPFANMREYARQRCNTGSFIEVYVKADLETCKERDPKGLYHKKIENFTGVDSTYEVPVNPELIIDTATQTVKESATLVLQAILSKQTKYKEEHQWTI